MWAHLLKIDGRVLGGMQFGGAGASAVLGVTVHACFCILTVGCTGACGAGAICDIDARVLSDMQVTVQAHFCILTVGCTGACCAGAICDIDARRCRHIFAS